MAHGATQNGKTRKLAEYTEGTWYSAAFRGGVIATSERSLRARSPCIQGRKQSPAASTLETASALEGLAVTMGVISSVLWRAAPLYLK